MGSSSHDATFYVQIKPSFSRYGSRRPDGSPSVDGLSAVGITKSRPKSPQGGTVTVKLTVRIPDAAFYPLAPEAVIVLPEDMILVNPIEVVAESPDE